jgi:DnaJ-domain-containing protein 1
MHQVDRDVLPLRVALEHAFEGELAADAAFFVTAVGVTRALTEALVHLNPTSLDRVCRAQSPADVMGPDVGGEPIVAKLERAAAQSPTEWWRVLEVAPSATKEEIVRNYRRKIQQCHPDRVTGLAPEFLELAEEHSKALNAAYAQAIRTCR